MKKFFFMLLCIASGNVTFSQNVPDTLKECIAWNATAILDWFTFPTLEFSVEKFLTPKQSIQIEIGYEIFNVSTGDSVCLKPKGFKVNLEYRLYLTNHFNLFHPYLALQPFYRNDQFNYDTGYENINENNNQNITYPGTIGVKRVIYGLNLVTGLKIGKRHRKYIEPYWGMGIMKRNVFNTHYIPPPRISDAWFKTPALAYSSGTDFNILFGIRLGYIF